MQFLKIITDGRRILQKAINSFSGNSDELIVTNNNGYVDHSLIRYPLSWVWEVYDTNVSNGTQIGLRHNGVPNTESRFSPFVKAKIFGAISSCTDTNDADIQIFINGGLILTLNHPINTSVQRHQISNLEIDVGDELYIIFQRVGGGNVTNITFQLYLQEILE